MTTRDLVDMVLAGRKEEAAATFDALMGEKISDSLEVKKVELASQTFNAPEVNEAAMSDRQLAAAAGADPATRNSILRAQKMGDVNKLALRDKNNLLRLFPKLFAANKMSTPGSAVRKALKDTSTGA
jgi:hypothetical protein